MARPLRIQFPGAFYHITSRGNEKKEIFRSRKDRERLLFYVESAAERYGAVVHSYCLMTNHYHLLMETPGGNLSEIMRYINGAYTTYFNVRRKRSGHLLQGRYKSIVVDADEYAMELSRYIHLNPVRAGMVGKPEDYEWSSYRAYVGVSVSPNWLKTDLILSSFGEKLQERNYRAFVEDHLEAEHASPLQGVIASTLLGTPEFVAQISEQHLNARKPDRSVPAVRALTRPFTIEDIVQKVEEIIPDCKPLARKVAMYACHRYGVGKLKEIGKYFGIGDSGVSQARLRLHAAAEKDKDLGELLAKVRRELNLCNVEF
jgi:putative transposase